MPLTLMLHHTTHPPEPVRRDAFLPPHAYRITAAEQAAVPLSRHLRGPTARRRAARALPYVLGVARGLRDGGVRGARPHAPRHRPGEARDSRGGHQDAHAGPGGARGGVGVAVPGGAPQGAHANGPVFDAIPNRWVAMDHHNAAREKLAGSNPIFADHTMRDARHTWAVRALRFGSPVEAVARPLGHVDGTLAPQALRPLRAVEL